jgi:hypothetical protein
VRKCAIGAKTVDQSADFRVQSNFERAEASKIEAKVRANARPSEFSHSLFDLCTLLFGVLIHAMPQLIVGSFRGFNSDLAQRQGSAASLAFRARHAVFEQL